MFLSNNRKIYKKILSLLLYKLWFWKKEKPNSLTVLTYHRITDEPDFHDALKVSVKSFEKQILFLKKNYNIISGEQLADIIKNNRPFPDKACFITFDDGWRDNYTRAFPILKKYKVPAIIFISTDYIGTNKVFWHERLVNLFTRIPSELDINKLREILNKWPANVSDKIDEILKSQLQNRRSSINELIIFLKSFEPQDIDKLINELEILFGSIEIGKKPAMLSWEEVKEMSQDNICFGSHTKSHAILTQVSENKIVEESRDSKYIIENKIGKPVFFLSYPNGNYNETIVKAAEKTGYLASFTCLSGVNYSYKDCHELKRKHIREEHSLGLNNEFSELFFKVELFGIRYYLKS